jgi:murein DD-endopeptidase MepM/ murein hydrolase activator NlpD
MKKLLCTLIALIISVANGSARADIYRLESDDDTVSFTDSPRDKRFQLIMKEQRSRQAKVDSSRQTRERPALDLTAPESHEAATGNSGNLPIQGRITSTTGLRSDPIDGKLKHHNGLDIAAPVGTPVKPVAPGTVIFSGWKTGNVNTVILDHNDGMVTVYAHHSSNQVTVGDQVDSSSVIALTGSTGRSTGPHLHFEAWRNGTNITADFMPGAAAQQQTTIAAAPPINRYLQSDGTLIFTNLR